LSVSTLSWTLSAAIAIIVAPVPGTIAGGGFHHSRTAARTPPGASVAIVRDTSGSVEIHTLKLDLAKLGLADFGDEPSFTAR
jgi:hypothetical protein